MWDQEGIQDFIEPVVINLDSSDEDSDTCDSGSNNDSNPESDDTEEYNYDSGEETELYNCDSGDETDSCHDN